MTGDGCGPRLTCPRSHRNTGAVCDLFEIWNNALFSHCTIGHTTVPRAFAEIEIQSKCPATNDFSFVTTFNFLRSWFFNFLLFLLFLFDWDAARCRDRNRIYVTHRVTHGTRALLLRNCQELWRWTNAAVDLALRFSRGGGDVEAEGVKESGGRGRGTETEDEPIRTRVASVADRPAKFRESRSRCPGTEGNAENESTGRCTSADVHARSERVLGGFDLVRIRAAHYAHIIGPTNRHRSPTIDPGPAGILLRRPTTPTDGILRWLRCLGPRDAWGRFMISEYRYSDSDAVNEHRQHRCLTFDIDWQITFFSL